jgi:hypothetical protein
MLLLLQLCLIDYRCYNVDSARPPQQQQQQQKKNKYASWTMHTDDHDPLASPAF